MEILCKPNMALHLIGGIRPNVVLECSFGEKSCLEKRVRGEARVLQEEVILV